VDKGKHGEEHESCSSLDYYSQSAEKKSFMLQESVQTPKYSYERLFATSKRSPIPSGDNLIPSVTLTNNLIPCIHVEAQ